MVLIKDRFVNRLDDIIWNVLFPKEAMETKIVDLAMQVQELKNENNSLQDDIGNYLETIEYLGSANTNLGKEYDKLKSKLENMPTLNRQSVEKIFKKGLKFLPNKPIYHYFSEKAIDKKIDDICKLAIREGK